MSAKLFILILTLRTLSFCCQPLQAADTVITLENSDGSSAFYMLNSSLSQKAFVDSAGNMVIRGGMRLDSAGVKTTTSELLIVDGYIGIGTDSPLARIDCRGIIRNGISSSYIEYFHSGTGAYWNWTDTGEMHFQYDGTSHVFLNNSGHLCVSGGVRLNSSAIFCETSDVMIVDEAISCGGVTPVESLTVGGRMLLRESASPAAAAGYGKIYAKTSDSRLYFMNDSGLETELTASGSDFSSGGEAAGKNRTLGNSDAYSLGIETAGITRMLITSSGKTGIGTSSPAATLEVEGDMSGKGMLVAYGLNHSSYLATTNSSSYVTLHTIQVYIPAGTSSLMCKVQYKINTNTAYIRMKMGGNTSSEQTTTSNSWVESGVMTLNVTGTGWQTVLIEGHTGFVSGGTDMYLGSYGIYINN